MPGLTYEWQVVASADLSELHFTELIYLPFWIEYYAEFADCPDLLAGIG